MIKPWKLILLLTGIFVAGGVTGAFVMMRVGREMILRRPTPEQWTPNHMKRLAERLDLKPEQIEQIRPIVRRNMDELNRLRNESVLATRAVFERMEREIGEKLTPEQREKLAKLNKEMRERVRRFMPDRQNRPPGPGEPRDRLPGEPGKPAGDQPPPPPDKPPGG